MPLEISPGPPRGDECLRRSRRAMLFADLAALPRAVRVGLAG